MDLNEKISVQFAETIDRLITIDISHRGVIQKLYDHAYKKLGGPLTYIASQKLIKKIGNEKKVVFILTGFPDRPWIAPEIPESDGPPGAAALARTIQLGFDCLPIIISEEPFLEVITSACRGAGLNIMNITKAKKAQELKKYGSMLVASTMKFPIEAEAGKKEAKRLISEFNPAAVISIERPGANEKGVSHGGNGKSNSEWVAKMHFLINEARKNNILTIGIGDGGNEIGMGIIRDAVKEFVPHGKKCLCSDGVGIADNTITDVLITSTVSNWGSYGLSACLAFMLKKPVLLHTEEMENRVLNMCFQAGALSGGSEGSTTPDVDGIPLNVHLSLIRIMNYMLSSWLDSAAK